MLNEETSDRGAAEDTGGERANTPADVFIKVADDQEDNWYGYNGKADDENQITSYDDAVEHVLEQHLLDGERTDIKVDDLDKWIFSLQDGIAVVGSPKDEHIYTLRHTAFSHLAARAKAPPGYLRSVPTRYSIPELNWGLRTQAEGPAMLRLAGDEARAIVSQRYAAFDDCVLFPALRTSLDAAQLLNSVKARVVATGLTTLVRLGIEGDAVAIPGTDEIAEIALDMTNGEVGNRAVALAPSVYLRTRSIATRRIGLRLRHLGSTDKLAASFAEAIPEVLAESRKLRDQIAKAVDRAIEDLVGEAEKLRAFGLSIAEAREVLRQVASGAGVELPHDTAEWEDKIATVANVRAYDVFVAVAALGEGRSIDRRLELEEAASKYLARATK
jgi:hypothetical protein